MERTHSGAASGLGAAYQWEGKKAGAGRMEIVESSPPSHLVMNLDFTRPFKAHNVVSFILHPLADYTTEATWVMQGESSYISKLMQVFVSMDRMVGKDFESGLATLKATAERDVADVVA